jgi:antitoxin component YwqK of YwqJK toxin-antitoxin module
MKKLLTLLAILLLASCNKSKQSINYDTDSNYFVEEQDIVYYKGSTFSGELYSLYSSGNIKYKRSFYDGKKDGVYETYYENGQLEYKISMRKNLKEGISEFYYENGKLRKREIYKIMTDESEEGPYLSLTSQKDGIWEDYYESGQLHWKKSYKAMSDYAQENGLWESYFENGQLKLRETFKDGFNIGLKESYYINGQLEFKERFHKNVGTKGLDGLTEKYYPNGQLKFKGNYKENQGFGVTENYYQNGQLERKESPNGEGWIIENFNEKGKITRYEDYFLGISNELVTYNYYANKDLKTIERYKKGKMDGAFEYYYRDGSIDRIISWKNNKRHGITEHYFSFQKKYDFPIPDNIPKNLASREYYKNGKRDGVYESFYSEYVREVYKDGRLIKP